MNIIKFLRQQSLWVARIVLFILYAVGVVGHLLPQTRGLMLAFTPWFLALCGLATVIPWLIKGPGRTMWFWVTALLTFALEAIGVATGQVFGSYHYGPVLGLAIFGVPVVIAFNWSLVVGGLAWSLRRLPWPLAALGTGVLAVVFDWVMEPVAMHLNYWQWAGNSIPLQNYLAWFVIAAISAIFLVRLERKKRPGPRPAGENLLSYYVAIQFLFFGMLRLFLLGNAGPVAI